MVKFSIEFLPQESKEDNFIGQFGRIILGDFSEDFVSATCNWNVETYINHWLKSSQRILYDCDTTIFITSIVLYSPTDYQINWWVAHKVDAVVYIQNQLIIPDTYFILGGFNLENIYSYITAREIYSDDGDKISEWEVSLKWIEEYYLRNKVILG